MSEGTVRSCVSSILSKLGVSNRAEAAAYAVQHHLKDYLSNATTKSGQQKKIILIEFIVASVVADPRILDSQPLNLYN